MPSEKRERQRAGREVRREAARAAQKRAQRRRQIIAIVALIAVIFGIGFVVSQSGDDGTEVTSGDDADAKDEGEDAETQDDREPNPDAIAPECPPDGGASERNTAFKESPPNCLEDGKDYKAVVETDVGTFTIDLLEEKAPKTVNNFVFLARHKAYEGVPFHRVIQDFVVQGGDVAKGDGTGDAGYSFEDELPEPGDYAEGSVAMANSGPNTNGSQFFIVTSQKGAETLTQAVGGEAKYSLFATVVDGMDVVKKIEADGSEQGEPKVKHQIVKVTIETAG
ncbi:MAG TPA: peptidylprolyl isomerase [Acidimicrobiales bacterium]